MGGDAAMDWPRAGMRPSFQNIGKAVPPAEMNPKE